MYQPIETEVREISGPSERRIDRSTDGILSTGNGYLEVRTMPETERVNKGPKFLYRLTRQARRERNDSDDDGE